MQEKGKFAERGHRRKSLRDYVTFDRIRKHNESSGAISRRSLGGIWILFFIHILQVEDAWYNVIQASPFKSPTVWNKTPGFFPMRAPCVCACTYVSTWALTCRKIARARILTGGEDCFLPFADWFWLPYKLYSILCIICQRVHFVRASTRIRVRIHTHSYAKQ